MQLEDERRHADQYKEQVEKVCISTLYCWYFTLCYNTLCLYGVGTDNFVLDL
jgi:hypothetical protein